ncbi:MAG: TRAP transporter TatT component family protein, partial [Holophagales bacterium]|nr:TRAP transporter TatT component family protein [Holophagales bacterium]
MFGPEPGPASDSQSRAGGIPLRRAAVLGTGLLAACTLLGGCSLEKMAVRSLADTLGSGAETFAEDDDPELVGQALPFALKTFELLLASDPENAGLLLSACSGFTQYAYAYAALEAERAKPVDYRESRRQMERATRLYLRGRDYCLQALELEAPGVGEGLVRRPE